MQRSVQPELSISQLVLKCKMLNVFTHLLLVIVALHFKTCVCDVWDDADQQRMLAEFIPELYGKYRNVLDGSDEATFTFRRALYNKEYIIHINRLKAVNGFKKHNLIVKERSDDNPLIYINNPVETKVPNSYLTLEGFKELLVGRAQSQRNELEKKKNASSTSKYSMKKLKIEAHQTKRIHLQTKPSKHVKHMKAKKKTMVPNATDFSITNNKTTLTDTTKVLKHVFKALVTMKNKSTIQEFTTKKLNNNKMNTDILTTKYKTAEVTTDRSTTKDLTPKNTSTEGSFLHVSMTIKPTLYKVTNKSKDEMTLTDQPIHEKYTAVKSATIFSQKLIIEKLTYNLTTEGKTTEEMITKKSTEDKNTTEKFLENEHAETTVNILRTHVESDDHKSEEVRKNATMDEPLSSTNETFEETNISNTTETLNIERHTAELAKKSVIVEFLTKEVTAKLIKKEVATTPEFSERMTSTYQPSTIISRLRRKSTSKDQESSDERDWTKRLTSRQTTKATTRRSTLGRPLVYMGGNNDGWDRWK